MSQPLSVPRGTRCGLRRALAPVLPQKAWFVFFPYSIIEWTERPVDLWGTGKKMEPTVIVAVVSLAGTLAGTFAGVLTGAKLTNYRLKQLEAKVERHNRLVERTYRLEGQVLELQHDVRDLKENRREMQK